LTAGTYLDFGAIANRFAQAITNDCYVFPDTEAGMDGFLQLYHTDITEYSSVGAMCVQSKVRGAFDIVAALLRFFFFFFCSTFCSFILMLIPAQTHFWHIVQRKTDIT
jgi:hypothetical protein